VRGLRGKHGTDAAYAVTASPTGELGILLPPVEKLLLGTFADLAMPFGVAFQSA
jgi:hypothetical protein